MVCVTSPKYTLMINGEIPVKRGLRQGDPLSPLLFVLCIEYHKRTIEQCRKNKEEFKFHPRCRQLKLNNLCFADDLLVFSKGDIRSVKLILQGIRKFYEALFLQANNSKSEIYHAVMDALEVHEVCNTSGFKSGILPFRHLGVPVCARKLKVGECEALIEKMVARIRALSTRKISFAGRLQLVNSVLMSFCTYWAQIFLLPQL